MASNKSNSNSQSSTKIAMEVGAGVLAAAAAGAGYYFYAGKHSEKHRNAAAKWAKDLKNKVVKETKTLAKIDQKSVALLVDRAASVYQNVRTIDKNDLSRAAKELKANWKEIQKEIGQVRTSAAKKVTSVKKAVVKKAASVTKKAVPKKAAPKKSGSKR